MGSPSTEFRRRINTSGISKLFGIPRTQLYRRINEGLFSLEGIERTERRREILYDFEQVLERAYPTADKNTLSMMMFWFTQENGGHVK